MSVSSINASSIGKSIGKSGSSNSENAIGALPGASSVCSAITASPALQPLRQTCELALTLKKNLPDFVCQETVQRFRTPESKKLFLRSSSSSHDRSHLEWEPDGLLKAEVRFNQDGETYSDITFDGRPVNLPAGMTKTVQVADAVSKKTKGTWIVGEFGSDLNFIFDLRNHAAFVPAIAQAVPPAMVFNFTVRPENSNYRWTSGNQSAHPGMVGSLWIDPASRKLQRVTLRATGIQEGFPLDTLFIDTRYGMVTISDAGSFLLPESSSSVQCFAGSNHCVRTVLEFHSCGKFRTETHMVFNGEEP